jgi:carbon storage regulator CsrA
LLVLSRRSQESVVVGGANGSGRLITVTVLEIGTGKVRLGFEADADVPVHRSEVWERIHANGAPDSLIVNQVDHPAASPPPCSLPRT